MRTTIVMKNLKKADNHQIERRMCHMHQEVDILKQTKRKVNLNLKMELMIRSKLSLEDFQIDLSSCFLISNCTIVL